ncbi:hypothetical protein [Mycobacterium sp. PSTR-4-N]|uniref:hypothetical protein n=1 Tax=Mycobacterium sp. PSTR-4-N TaxID=2917745 RepID=UPI001F14D14F|nr:hypothetical protein [Mycobacterium sp. PSTR-4-N]MCG7597085.1 hypothetical protein [Mycobacterium sp. PSTR-4-N]
MAAVVVLSMMAATGLLGFYLGRRAASPRPSWRQRTRRPALARQAVSLVTLVAVSQLQRSVRGRVTPRRGRVPSRR